VTMGRGSGRLQAAGWVALLCVTYFLAPLNTVVALLGHDSYHRLHGESGSHIHADTTPQHANPHDSGAEPGHVHPHTHAQESGAGPGRGHAHAPTHSDTVYESTGQPLPASFTGRPNHTHGDFLGHLLSASASNAGPDDDEVPTVAQPWEHSPPLRTDATPAAWATGSADLPSGRTQTLSSAPVRPPRLSC